MMARVPRPGLPAAGYAALVDILIATMGIFIVVFTQLQLDDAPRLVPARVDGLAICQAENDITLHRWQSGQEVITTVTLADLRSSIETLWPSGARLIIGMTQSCAYSPSAGELWELETAIRRVTQAGANYLADIFPVSAESAGASSVEELRARWRAGMALE